MTLNGYIPLMILGLILAVIPFFFIPLPIYLLCITAAVLTIVPIIAGKVIIKKMYPVSLRIWEQRYDGITIFEQTRAKRIRRDEQEYYVTIGGKWFRAPEHKYIVTGMKDSFADIFSTGDESFSMGLGDIKEKDGDHYIEPPREKDIKKLSIVPEDLKFWLATQIQENVAVTTPEKSTFEKMIPIMLIGVTGITLMVMLVSFMQYFPEFVAQTTNVMQAQIQALTEVTDKFTTAIQAQQSVPVPVQNTGTPTPH